MLFTRNVSGPRVVSCDGTEKSVGPVKLKNFGASSEKFQTPYIALASAIGMQRKDVLTNRLYEPPPNNILGVAAVRFLRGTLFAEVRIGIRDLRVKSAVRQIRQYALFAAIRIKPNYALFSL